MNFILSFESLKLKTKKIIQIKLFNTIGRPRKNYKIIFIKTPSYGLKSQIIPVLPRIEDKTIVYVLSKKPTFDQNIQLPEPAPTGTLLPHTVQLI